MINQNTLALVIGLTLMSALASGAPIVAGSMAAPDLVSNSSGMTLLAGTGPVQVDPVPGYSFNITYSEWVYRDAGNVFCPSCLTFAIQVTNAGPGAAERVTAAGFSIFATDLGYSTVSLPGGATASGTVVTPISVSRSGDADVVGFDFIPPGMALGRNSISAPLIIETNATNFVPGYVSVQDGVAGFGPGYSPDPSAPFVNSAIPEPAFLGIVGIALLIATLAQWIRRA